MKHTLYLSLCIIFVVSCRKDGTEKRCDKGFTGRNCAQEITPSKIQVTEITATKLPPFDGNGSNWDPLGGKPDIYFRIVEESTGLTVMKSGYGNNMNPAEGASVDLSGSSILMNSPTARYIIEAWDYDDIDADDYMGGIIFTPYIEGEQFPKQRHLSCSGCNTAWTLDFTYLF